MWKMIYDFWVEDEYGELNPHRTVSIHKNQDEAQTAMRKFAHAEIARRILLEGNPRFGIRMAEVNRQNVDAETTYDLIAGVTATRIILRIAGDPRWKPELELADLKIREV